MFYNPFPCRWALCIQRTEGGMLACCLSLVDAARSARKLVQISYSVVRKRVPSCDGCRVRTESNVLLFSAVLCYSPLLLHTLLLSEVLLDVEGSFG